MENLKIRKEDITLYISKEFVVRGARDVEISKSCFNYRTIEYVMSPEAAMEKFPWLIQAVRKNGNGKRKFSWSKDIGVQLVNNVHFEYYDYEFVIPSWWEEMKEKFIRVYALMNPKEYKPEVWANLWTGTERIEVFDFERIEEEAKYKGDAWFLYHAEKLEKLVIEAIYNSL